MVLHKVLLLATVVLVLALPLLKAENLTFSDDECVIRDIVSRISIASDIIETAKQRISNDLEKFCRKNSTGCNNGTKYVKPIDCSDHYENGERRDGLYVIWPQSRMTTGPLHVYCDMKSNGGGWTVIQRRGDYKSPNDYFFREWYSYKIGFGDKLKDFWIGNDNLFALTNQRSYHLRVNLTDWEDNSTYATYDEFWISDENFNYTLHVEGYRGTAGDSLKRQNGSQFSTKDRDNDSNDSSNCAESFKGAWWYSSCMDSNLNGMNFGRNNTHYGEGMVWKTFRGFYYSLKDTVMKIRPVDFEGRVNKILN